MKPSVPLVLLAGLLLVLVLGGVTLSRAPLIVARTNAVPEAAEIAHVASGKQICQGGERLPRGTSAIRLAVNTGVGPSVALELRGGARVLAHGSQISGWRGASVTVPLEHRTGPGTGVSVCARFGPGSEPVGLVGARSAPGPPATEAGTSLGGRMQIEYLRPGAGSWWSQAGAVAHRMGLGRAWPGSWVLYLVIALMLATVVLASRLVISGGSHGALICALVACLNAVCWSLLTPPFQVPDEQDHFAYAQALATTWRLPSPLAAGESAEERLALRDLHFEKVHHHPGNGKTISTAAEQRLLQSDLAVAAPAAHEEAINAGLAQAEPPLYYALLIVPYRLGTSGTLLDRLALMRLLSALMAGLTALFAFMFLREALPAAPWSWVVGGLGVAVFPLLGFMSGAVTSEGMLYAVSAALFYCLARAFRRGLTPRAAVGIGAVILVGLLTKLNFIGLVPGALLGLVLLALRARPSAEGGARRSLALALAVLVVPVLAYLLFEGLSGQGGGLRLLSDGVEKVTGHGSLWSELGYLWQFYLPRLPGMHDDFVGLLSTRQLWFDGLVGQYGWFDTPFPNRVNDIALIPAAAIAILLVCGLRVGRSRLRRRLPELLVYAAMALGLMVLVAANGYLEFPGRVATYVEPRYLLPLLAIWGAVLALAARGAGRRWGPAVGALIVVGALAHDLASQLLVIARYYG